MNKRSTTALIRVRRPVAALVLVVLAQSLLVLPAAEAAIPGSFCVGNDAVSGIGSFTQEPIWRNHFVPTFEDRCPEGLNKVLYDKVGDTAGVEAAIEHYLGDFSKPYMMYTTDLAMTTAEKYQAELDTRRIFRPALFSTINHFPALIYGVAVGYNLGTGCASDDPLKLSARQLSLIYSGVIAVWSDPLLVLGDPSNLSDDNPFLANCHVNIKVIVRQDPASTTITFKDYLSRDNPVFNIYKQKELNTTWPSTLRFLWGYGDAGVSTQLGVPGAIGYVGYQEARTQPGYKLALVDNSSKVFVAPASNIEPGERTSYPSGCTAAANTVVVASTIQDWSRVSMTGTALGYPLCAFSYILVFQRMLESYQYATANTQARTVVDFLTVTFEDATQDGLTAHGFAPLVPTMRTTVRTGVNMLSQ